MARTSHAPYRQLFAATLLMLGLLAQEPEPWIQQPTVLVLAAWLSWAGARTSERPRDIALLLALGTIPAVVELFVPFGQGFLLADLAKLVGWIGFPLLLAQRLFSSLYRARDISHHELLGAVTVYMLLGLTYANLYEGLTLLDPASITFSNGEPGPLRDFADFLYFSFVTLGTVGYGDVAPVTHASRLLAMSEAMMGVMYVAVVVGRVVGLHTAQATRRTFEGTSADPPAA